MGLRPFAQEESASPACMQHPSLQFGRTVTSGYFHFGRYYYIQWLDGSNGDVYQVQHARTREFTERIRSIVAPYLIAGVPMFTHRTMMGVFPSLQSAYVVLILPRVVMFLASLAVDGAVYFEANDFDLDRKMALILCSTSYVTIGVQCTNFHKFLRNIFL
ncbi:hypothetical protein FSP39_004663 [Pinctada imbricata]|uniref:Uncharacterized protein n=1 Tax=Pinctada imbricata TaxID=66713 RepID=A0AA89BY10_PINIB|nr:hypothetical protein FSP39_004663 [Pinctada imbricata]